MWTPLSINSGSSAVHPPQVVHQAVIAVHEKGTRAAAATAVVMARPSAHREPTPVIFRADHPFVYAIRSRFGNDLLFLGRLVDPSVH
jgi:serpin B